MGDMVLIMTDSLPRMQWPLGLVEEVLIWSDRLVRSVVVKLQDGRVKRPITKVILLEADGDDELHAAHGGEDVA